MNGPLLVIGGGGHARAVIEVAEAAGLTVGGIVERPGSGISSVLGYPVVGSDADLPALARDFGAAVVAIGQIRSPVPRREAYARLCGLGFALPAVVSPLARVSRHATLGAGTVVMHFACVNAGAVVGQNCIINTRALVEHDAIVGDHCHISTGAILNGNVRTGDGCFVGSGTVCREGVVIGAGAVVGMGSVVSRDVEADTLFRTHHTHYTEKGIA